MRIKILCLFCGIFLSNSSILAQGVDYGCDIVKYGDNGNSAEASEYILFLPSTTSTQALYQTDGEYFKIANHSSILGNYNYVQETTVLVDGIKTDADVEALLVGQCVRKVTYADDLGRPIQSVMRDFSPSQKDLVTPFHYDDLGRVDKSYMSYVANEGCGLYRQSPLLGSDNTYQTSEHYLFYNDNSNNNADKIANDNYPFSEVVYEPSPANQILQKFSPGSAWEGSKTLAVQHSNTVSYRLNNGSEVLQWSYDYTTGNASASFGGLPVYFSANRLVVIQVTDEQGQSSFQYTDQEGKVLCVKTPKPGGFLQTYYIYNDMNQLCYVLSPQGVNLGINSLAYTDANTIKWATAYKYDTKGRLIENQLPGGKKNRYIYDKLDRVILSQDANLAASNKWKFVKFDKFGRTLLMGVYTNTATQSSIQTEVNGLAALYEQKASGGNYEGYTNNAFPCATCSTTIVNADLKNVAYYDNYDLTGDGVDDYSYSPITVNGYTTPTVFARVDGSAVGIKTRNLTTATWLININFYDKYDRVIQIQKNNHLFLAANPTQLTTLKDNTTFFYSYSGLLLKTYEYHYVDASRNTTIQQRFSYDHIGRALSSYHQINTQPEVMLANYQYNELGQLVDKKLHSEDNGQKFLQSVDFRYHIRGWLSTINNSTLTSDLVTNDETNDLFGMQLLYETADLATGLGTNMNVPRFDGLISGVKWKTNNAANTSGTAIVNERGYAYSYDLANRLSATQYAERSATSTYWTASNNFVENNFNYDDNGNIGSLKRYNSTGNVIDDLNYSSYDGNKLLKVTDASSLTSGFKSTSTAQQATAQYTYDPNGNVLTDANRGISTNIVYNYLDLPEKIVTSSATITFQYSASGQMLSRTVATATTTTNDYVDGYLYKDGVQQYVSTAEGRAELILSLYDYTYDLIDNLGNVRISFHKDPTTGTAQVVQEDHFYVYGLRHGEGPTYTGGNQQYFIFTGKEFIQDLTMYDFGARMLDPALGRWFVQDPANQGPSPYAFFSNNPVNFVDIDGQSARIPSRGDGYSPPSYSDQLFWAPGLQSQDEYGRVSTFSPAQYYPSPPILVEKGMSVLQLIGDVVLISSAIVLDIYFPEFAPVIWLAEGAIQGAFDAAERGGSTSDMVNGAIMGGALGMAGAGFAGEEISESASLAAEERAVETTAGRAPENLYASLDGGPPDLAPKADDAYGALEKDRSGTVDDFVDKYTGKSEKDIATEAGIEDKGIWGKHPLGPKLRYLEDPLAPGKYIDMRHFMVIGKEGPGYGLANEIKQWFGREASAFNKQDFFSNELGERFFYTYYSPHSGQSYAEQVRSYLKNPKARTRMTTGDW
jgi:RHS repeat-associated protein